MSNDDEDYLKMVDKFAEMDKRRAAQYAGKFGEVHKWWLAENRKTKPVENIAISALSI